MSTNGTQERHGRETRLLVLVVLVSLAVLLVIARFRFPSTSLTAPSPATGPLAELAGRNTFDDLASTLVTLLKRVEPRVLTIRLDPVPPEARRGRASRTASTSAPPVEGLPSRALIGIRVRPDVAAVFTPAGFAPASRDDGAPLEVAGINTQRQFAVLRVSGPGTAFEDGADPFPEFAFVAELIATPGGVTVQPRFLGRAVRSADVIWGGDVIDLPASSGASAGSPLVTMDGHLVGVVANGPSGLVVVPAATLRHAVDDVLGPGTSGQ